MPQSCVLIGYLRHASINISYRRPGVCGEATIDVTNHFVQVLLELLILLNISPAWHCYLEQHHLEK